MTCEVQEGLPAYFLGDPFRIRQILTNLIGNAVKFTARGGVNIRLQKALDSEEGSSKLEFVIRDTGIGIPSDRFLSLFERFTQGDSSDTRRFGGTGLGLAICRGLAEKMGGRIWIQSVTGEGSEFHFTCDMLPVAPQKKEELKALQPGVGGGIPTGPVKLLYVEDDVVSGLVIKRIGEKRNWEVSLASSGGEALELLRDSEFDLILMDVQMPEMDGCTVTEIIRGMEIAGRRSTPIIAATAYALSGDMEKFLQAGMDDYLSKPINMDKLYQMIEKWRRP